MYFSSNHNSDNKDTEQFSKLTLCFNRTMNSSTLRPSFFFSVIIVLFASWLPFIHLCPPHAMNNSFRSSYHPPFTWRIYWIIRAHLKASLWETKQIKSIQSLCVNDIFKDKLKKKINPFGRRHNKNVTKTRHRVKPSKFVHFYYYLSKMERKIENTWTLIFETSLGNCNYISNIQRCYQHWAIPLISAQQPTQKNHTFQLMGSNACVIG